MLRPLYLFSQPSVKNRIIKMLIISGLLFSGAIHATDTDVDKLTGTHSSKIAVQPFPLAQSAYGGNIGTWDINIYVESDKDQSDKDRLKGKITVYSEYSKESGFPVTISFSDFKRSKEKIVIAGKNMTIYKHIIYLPGKGFYYFRPELYSEKSGRDYILGLTWRCGELESIVLKLFNKVCEK